MLLSKMMFSLDFKTIPLIFALLQSFKVSNPIKKYKREGFEFEYREYKNSATLLTDEWKEYSIHKEAGLSGQLNILSRIPSL